MYLRGLFPTRQLSSIIWGISDSFEAAGNLSPMYWCSENRHTTVLSREGFAEWEMPFLCLVHLPCSGEEFLKAFSLEFYFLIPKRGQLVSLVSELLS